MEQVSVERTGQGVALAHVTHEPESGEEGGSLQQAGHWVSGLADGSGAVPRWAMVAVCSLCSDFTHS